MRSLSCPTVSTLNNNDFRTLLNYVVAKGEGPNTIFILGTTGEAYSISLEAKKQLIDIAAEEISRLKEMYKHNSGLNLKDEPGRSLELAVGITEPTIEKTVELAQYAEEAGADHAVFMPIYVKQEGRFTRKITSNVEHVLDKTKKINFILYNLPSRTGGKNIRKATLGKLSRYERIVGIKDSSGNPVRVKSYIKAAGGFAEVDVGDEILGLELNKGRIVAGSSNILPVPYNIAVFGNRDEDTMVARTVENLIRFQKVYAKNPIGAFKYMLNKLGVLSSPQTINPGYRVELSFAEKLDELLLDKDFDMMQRACLA
jgi:4-hydroxy-tetrahydrodipicolinate synthase